MEYTDYYKAFCKRMSIDRKMKNYDQSAMAERVGMTTPEYSNRESGRSMVSGTDLKKLWDSGADIDKLLVSKCIYFRRNHMSARLFIHIDQ